MAQRTDSTKKAARLARAIAADIALYNAEAIEAGRARGDVYAAIQFVVEEGRALFLSRVSERVAAMGLFDRAVDELVVNPQAAAPVPKKSPKKRARARSVQRQRVVARRSGTVDIRADSLKGDTGRGIYRTTGKSAKYSKQSSPGSGFGVLGALLLIAVLGLVAYFFVR